MQVQDGPFGLGLGAALMLDVIIAIVTSVFDAIALASFWFVWVIVGIGCIMAAVSLGMMWGVAIGIVFILLGGLGAWRSASNEN